MAAVPTPEEAARTILRIFTERFDARPGSVLRSNNFIATIGDFGLTAQEFNAGLAYAVKQGWIEIQSDGYSYKITEAGFKEA